MLPDSKHQRYMSLAREISGWSKDPSKGIGAVAVGEDGQILSQGFNGFPRKVEDLSERWGDRETKLRFVVHAEKNMVYNACLNGTSLKGSTIYVWGLPVCSECAKGLIQVGVKRVFFSFPPGTNTDKWEESSLLGEEMFKEVGISIIYLTLDKDSDL